MNPEALDPIPEKYIARPEILGRVCWNLANELTHNRWITDEVRRAESIFSQSEQLGVKTQLGNRIIPPILNDIHAEFYASKEAVEGYRGNPVDIDMYRLILSIGQSIERSEIPPHVLDKILEAIGDFDEDDETILGEVATAEDLDELDIVREQIISYDVTGDGDIESYDLTYTYSLNDEIVHGINYSSTDDGRVTMPVVLHETDEVIDWRPAQYTELSAAQLEREIQDVDASWDTFMQEKTLAEITSFGAQDEREHRRQALAIVSLIGAEKKYRLKKLAKK